MREIKYRIFLNGTFHYWGFIEQHGHLIFAGLPQNNRDTMTMEEARNRSQQFTGLHDRNGKEIWEGDIVYYQETKCEVIFHILFFGFILQTKESRLMMHEVINFTVDSGFGIQTKQLKVIGNIYENPDLLK